MTQQDRHKAEESWTYYRAVFNRRSRHFPSQAIFLPLIDRIYELGYAEQFFAGTSLDNLVISIRPNPRDRQQTILVVPQEDAVEFRLYPKDGETEVSTVTREQAVSALDRLLPRLAADLETSSRGTADGDSEA
ncbi:MAG TPA: hypothetical protein VMF69_11355 [Gemmataceae bacterium]|nr:hypothetical protein [Gemmataceae bacterium]